MKNKFFILFILLGMFLPSVSAQPLETGVEKQEFLKSNRIIDSNTNLPVANAQIMIPQTNYKTYSDKNGYFTLRTNMNSDTIISVSKDGYRPFTTTFLKDTSSPLKLSLQKQKLDDISIECDMCHLGDDTFSMNSANSGDFKIKASGPFYSKTFKISDEAKNRENYLVIGSIIGIDTSLARKMGQNHANSYATAPEIYFNGVKIAEIQLNGDNQRIKIPNDLIRENSENEVTIKTGHNILQSDHLDYDDIEFMNLSLQSE
ncbi:MAG: carboxypeptidase-like regulatory domain-containing protein [Clostridiaceae bacterium]|jgi:hypothetical protein|nr:carboxypeptidase-like regulatory domain-containing protein [Clostridiaceae bacterium]